jgi:hypothetical protein
MTEGKYIKEDISKESRYQKLSLNDQLNQVNDAFIFHLNRIPELIDAFVNHQHHVHFHREKEYS